MAVDKIVKYVTTVKCPDDIWTKYGETQEFDRMFCEATVGSIHAEIDHFGNVELIAEYWLPQDAEACDYRLRKMLLHFIKKSAAEKFGDQNED